MADFWCKLLQTWSQHILIGVETLKIFFLVFNVFNVFYRLVKFCNFIAAIALIYKNAYNIQKQTKLISVSKLINILYSKFEACYFNSRIKRASILFKDDGD